MPETYDFTKPRPVTPRGGSSDVGFTAAGPSVSKYDVGSKISEAGDINASEMD
jgi:hypothetical protein